MATRCPGCLFLLAADRARLFVLAVAIICCVPSALAFRSPLSVPPPAIQTSPLETRVGGFAVGPSGRPSLEDSDCIGIVAGCADCGYETASGRRKWPNGDPRQEGGGINLFQFCGGDPINKVDPWGLTWSQTYKEFGWYGREYTAELEDWESLQYYGDGVWLVHNSLGGFDPDRVMRSVYRVMGSDENGA